MGAIQSKTGTRRWIGLLATGAFLGILAVAQPPQSTILPGLYSSPNCDSPIELRNLSRKAIEVQIDGHRSDGSLTGLKDSTSNRVKIAPGQKRIIYLDVAQDEAWAVVLEQTRVLAISAQTSCRDNNQVFTVNRPAGYPVSNPGLQMAYDQVPRDGSQLLILNPGDISVEWTACYSGGHLISNDNGEMIPLCSENLGSALAPFSSIRIDMFRDNRALVKLQTAGPSVVLQMMKPDTARLNLFRVDSTIHFHP